MIIRPNKTYERNSMFPNTNWYRNEVDNIVIDETTTEGLEIAERILSAKFGYDLVIKDKKVIDVIVFTEPMDLIVNNTIDRLSNECKENIINNFTSSAFDGITLKKYDCTIEDQTNIQCLYNLANNKNNILNLCSITNSVPDQFQQEMLDEPIKWKASGEIESYVWEISQILKLGLDLKRHVNNSLDKFRSLKTYCLEKDLNGNYIRTKNELDNVNFDTIL